MDEFDTPEPRSTIPFPKKRGRKTNAERERLAAQSREEHGGHAPLTLWRPPEVKDVEMASKLDELVEVLKGRQLLMNAAIDFTGSTQPYDRDMRIGAGGISEVLGTHPLVRAAANFALMAFNTDCRVLSVTRGGFTIPPEQPYLNGTYLWPVLDRTAAAVLAFEEHVVESGATPIEGITLLISDFQFGDWAKVVSAVPAWKEFMRKHRQVVVSAMVGTYDRESAAVLSDPIPPVPVDKVSFASLFKKLAQTFESTLGGRNSLENELRAEFAKTA